MSNTLDDRAMQKMTPEEEIAHWKGVAEYHRTRADGEARCVRERVFTLMLQKAYVDATLKDAIESADEAVQYILHGKEDVLHPFDVPHVSLEELKSILMESLVTDLGEGKLRDGYIQCMKDVCKGVGLSTDFIE